MIDYSKYDLDADSVDFIKEMKEFCIDSQNEISLQYGNYPFFLEPSGNEIRVVDCTGVTGEYSDFDDFLINHKINGKSVIEIIRELEYGA